MKNETYCYRYPTPSIGTNSYFLVPRTRESSNPTTFQFISWSDSSGATYHISFKQIPVPTMEPFVGLGGPNPGSKLVAPTNKTLHYWPFRKVAQPTVSLEVTWGDAGTKFLHPEISMMSISALDLPLCRSISP